MDEEQKAEVKKMIEEALSTIFGVDRLTFQKNIQIFDARNIQLGKATGTKIGTATDQKLGFFDKAPVAQQGAITTPSGGGGSAADAVDQTARTAIGQIKTALQNLGLTA